jgi:4-phytase/acid phosphatase
LIRRSTILVDADKEARMRVRVLVVLLLCATAAQAQNTRKEYLQMVVALFRHGVRAPLKDLNAEEPRYTVKRWPSRDEWRVADWGELTPNGYYAVVQLGKAYAAQYKGLLPAEATAFLWADVDSRTKATARALSEGLNSGGIPATCNCDSLSDKPDHLFHAFKTSCAKPSDALLKPIAADITTYAPRWITYTYKDQFGKLYDVLDCDGMDCTKLSSVTDSATPCTDVSKCCDSQAPIKWKGQFPEANTMSETFLLEYENGMKPGLALKGLTPEEIGKMMTLHDFYFKKLQRNRDLAQVDASNLIREISARLNRTPGGCRVLSDKALFSALVGHDTNIASVAELLGLHWSFKNAPATPAGTNFIPDDDPLPAGALVFELWRRFNGSRYVRMYYMAQGVTQVRECKEKGCPAFRIPLRQMELDEFTKLAGTVAKPDFQCCQNGYVCQK